MFRLIFGNDRFWRGELPLGAFQWLRLLLCSACGVFLAYRRILWEGYVFVGNDSDLTFHWIPTMKFSRLWSAVGELPAWNPFFGLGRSLLQGPEHPASLLNLLQRLWADPEKGLDYTFVALALLAAWGGLILLVEWGFSPLVAVIGSLWISCTGMLVNQLFAGHIGIYSALALTPALLASFSWGLRRPRITACIPAALCTYAIVSTGELQGAYISLWTCIVWFCLRALLGVGDAALPGLWSACTSGPAQGERNSWQARVIGLLATLLRLAFVLGVGLNLSFPVWSATLQAGLGVSAPAQPFVHSAPVISWLTLFLPHLYLGTGQEYTWVGWAPWEGQVGLATATPLLLLLGWSRARQMASGGLLAALAALVAAGSASPILRLYSHLDPLCLQFEVPSRIYYAVNLGLWFCSCVTLDWLVKQKYCIPVTAQRLLLATAAALGAFWTLTYFSSGFNPFWLAFQTHLQFAYNYATEPVGTPAEYYVLFWSRLSAATALVLSLIYGVTRLPVPARKFVVPALLLLDVIRIPHPYLNLRPLADLVPPPALQDVLLQQSPPGRTLNRLQPLWTGSIALLRVPEWIGGIVVGSPEAELVEQAKRAMRKDEKEADLQSPGVFTRWLGVENYIHPSEFLQESGFRQAFNGMKNYSDTEGYWSVTIDPGSRGRAYISRSLAVSNGVFRMLWLLGHNPEALSRNTVYLSPNVHESVSLEIHKRGWERQPGLETPRPESAVVARELPNSVVVRCFLKASGMVCLNELWTPDWRATVDWDPVECIPAQLGLNRGVLVGPGYHEIRFYYEPTAALTAMRRNWRNVILVLLITGLLEVLSWTVRVLGDRSGEA